jgi:hypothetical protein
MKKQITDTALLDSMAMGERYTARRLALTHNTHEIDVRKQLIRMADAGIVCNEVIGRANVFAKVATMSAGLPPMAPMKVSREMRAAMERTKELRRYESKF